MKTKLRKELQRILRQSEFYKIWSGSIANSIERFDCHEAAAFRLAWEEDEKFPIFAVFLANLGQHWNILKPCKK